jgi:hypothetical protein
VNLVRIEQWRSPVSAIQSNVHAQKKYYLNSITWRCTDVHSAKHVKIFELAHQGSYMSPQELNVRLDIGPAHASNRL